MRRVKNFIWKILNKIGIGGAVQLLLTGELKDNGWFKSFETKQAIDKNRNPIPWNTYSYIKFIERRLKKSFDVFEFGGGNSTIWYGQRVGSVKAVEHDKNWIEYISKKMPSNAKIVCYDSDDIQGYSGAVSEENKKYDIIIVDGRNRIECTKQSIESLKEDGVVVFDNSDLKIYTEAIEFLENNGFKRLDFYGMSPVTPHTNCTSVFYRTNNCLGI